MKLLRVGLAAAIVLLPPAALAAGKKANSIDELAKMYEVTSYKKCHAEVFAEWEKSYYAASLVGSPRTMATIAGTIKDGLRKEYTHSGAKEVKDLTVEHLMICAKCHLPQLKDATDAVAREIAQAAIDGAAGDKMAYGPHRKSGMLRDTALQPGQTKAETFEINFPYMDMDQDGKKVRNVTAKELDVVVSLWHLPAGGELAKLEAGKGKFLFHESTRRVTVK